MLPYRRRPPAFATKEFRAQQEALESAEERYSGGGPIQRAMEKDLVELRPRFLQLIETLTASSPQQQHVSPGTAFSCFKQVFQQAKVALVHTRTLPPRSDRGAYIQLLYSSCLSLLNQAFPANHNVVVWEHAVYAIFCLYALYETNPLPPAPRSPLQMLTVGLLHPDNPKFLYRRSFQSPIRIDWRHYSLLQRLYDEALAQTSDCQCARMKSHAGTAIHDEDDESLNWKCTCGVFIDIVQVVDRLMPNLDLTETTGPSGLDALVGHADYPWGCERPKHKKGNATTGVIESLENDLSLCNNELDAIAEVQQANVLESGNLDDAMQQYKLSLKRVRLTSSNMSGSNQATRVRNALKPIFNQTITETTEHDAANVAGREKENEQTQFSALKEATTNASATPAVQGEAALAFVREEGHTADTIVVERKNALKDLNYELVLPTDLSDTLRNGIEAALNAAIESGDIRIERKTESLGESNRNDESSEALQRGLLEDDEDVYSREHETNRRGGMFGSNFLATGTYTEAGDIGEESDSSDLLSVASEDSTTIGRMTLHTLLTAAGEDDVLQSIHRKHKPIYKRGRQSSSAATAAQRQPRKRSSTKSLSRLAVPVREDLLTSSSDDDGSLLSEENTGRASLQALLSAVRNKDSSAVTAARRQPRKRPSLSTKSLNRLAVPLREDLLSSSSDDDGSLSPEENTGRASLQALLSAVRNKDDGGRTISRQQKPRLSSRTISPQKSKPRGQKRSISRDEGQSESSQESDSDIDDNLGRASLHALLSAINNDDGQSKRPHKAPKKRKTVTSAGRQGYRGKKRPRKLVIQSSGPPSISSDESVESINVGRMSLETLLGMVNVDNGNQNSQNIGEDNGRGQASSSVNRTQIREQPIKASQPESDEDFFSRASHHRDREAGSSISSEDHNSDDGGSTEHFGWSDYDSLMSSQQGQAALGILLSLVSEGNDTK